MEIEKKGLNQEMLKLIDCITMLIDHVGAVLLPGMTVLRIIGRIAFPIYCFLLAEGAHHTRNPQKYGLRLLIGAVLSEVPFDLAVFGRISWQHQSVMVTLLVGFLMAMCLNRVKGFWKIPVMVPFIMAAELMMTDYGGMGVAMIGLFVLTRQMQGKFVWQMLGMAVLCWNGMNVNFLGFYIPVEMFAILALIPIGLYSGGKATYGKAVQWAFYLFYPIHLGLLWLISVNVM